MTTFDDKGRMVHGFRVEGEGLQEGPIGGVVPLGVPIQVGAGEPIETPLVPFEARAPDTAGLVTEAEPGNVVDLRSRQQRRAEAREAKKTFEDVYSEADAKLKPLLKARHMLFALIRSQGRVRIPHMDLRAVQLEDKLDVHVDANGDLTVGYVEGR